MALPAVIGRDEELGAVQTFLDGVPEGPAALVLSGEAAIAAELFMGVSTVESHLSRVYRKLGVRRAELAGRIAIPMDEAVEAEGFQGFGSQPGEV